VNDDSEEEFVDWSEPVRRGRKPDAAAKLAFQKQHAAALGTDPSHVRAGVSMTWLSTAFKMDLRTVKNRLGRLKPIGNGGPRNSAVYDFSDACTHLAKPPMDQFARYMRSMRVQDMPTHLQESYWGALRKKQIWEIAAGELWKTNDVLDVYGETFKTLKSTMQLWVDNLDTKGEMTQAQRDALTQMVDGLLKDLNEKLVEMPKLRKTGSSLYDPDANPDSAMRYDEQSDEDLIG
jgi:hypothetical protein